MTDDRRGRRSPTGGTTGVSMDDTNDIASEWGADLTTGFKLARIAVPTAAYDRSGYNPHDKLAWDLVMMLYL